jgi:transcription antitermination protein NusB
MTHTKAPRPPRRSDGRSRSASRLAVVQALYQMELSGQDSESALREFIEHRLGQEVEGQHYAQADHKYFSEVLRGVVARQEEIDGALAKATGKAWSFDRIDATMRAILRAGSYELIANAAVPVRVIMHEYLNVATAFFGEKSDDMNFLSGILFQIARQQRPDELGTLSSTEQ